MAVQGGQNLSATNDQEEAGGEGPAHSLGQSACLTGFPRPVFIRNCGLHGAADRVTFQPLCPQTLARLSAL